MAKKNKNEPPVEKLICNSCGADNKPSATECISCGKTKFAPPWVIAKRPLNRQVSVEITKPNPKFGKAEPRITLSKWWPGGRTSYHLSNADQWEKIARIINEDLGPIIGWKTAKEIVDEIKN